LYFRGVHGREVKGKGFALFVSKEFCFEVLDGQPVAKAVGKLLGELTKKKDSGPAQAPSQTPEETKMNTSKEGIGLSKPT